MIVEPDPCCEDHRWKYKECPHCGWSNTPELLNDGNGHIVPGLYSCNNFDCPGSLLEDKVF